MLRRRRRACSPTPSNRHAPSTRGPPAWSSSWPTATRPWALPWPVVHEFLRLVTHRHAVARALGPADAWAFVEALLASPSRAPARPHRADTPPCCAEVLASLAAGRGRARRASRPPRCCASTACANCSRPTRACGASRSSRCATPCTAGRGRPARPRRGATACSGPGLRGVIAAGWPGQRMGRRHASRTRGRSAKPLAALARTTIVLAGESLVVHGGPHGDLEHEEEGLWIGAASWSWPASVGGRRRARPRTKPLAVQTAKVETAGDRAEGERHGEDPAQDPGRDQRRRERQDHPARRSSRGSGSRRALSSSDWTASATWPRSRAPRPTCAPREANAALVRENMNQAREGVPAVQGAAWSAGLESQSVFEAEAGRLQVEVARYKAAPDQVEQAKAALKQARDDLSKTTIYAPMAGTISALNKEQGEIALGSQFQKDVILVIADLTEMEAQVNVDENDIVVHRASASRPRSRWTPCSDQPLKGAVARDLAAAPTPSAAGPAEQKTEFEIKIGITDPPPTLRPGMTASADIVTKTNDERAERAHPERRACAPSTSSSRRARSARTPRRATRPTRTASWRSSSASRRARRSPSRSRPASRATS